MKLKAYMNISWISEEVHAMPGEKEDTLGRLQRIMEKCSKISGLLEMHVVFGPIAMVATAEVDTMEELTQVQNEIEKALPIRKILTFVVQPQLRPGEKPKNPNFT